MLVKHETGPVTWLIKLDRLLIKQCLFNQCILAMITYETE